MRYPVACVELSNLGSSALNSKAISSLPPRDLIKLRSLLIALCAMFVSASALGQTTLSLKQIMADPDWIGQPVASAWWQLDGAAIYFEQERPNSDLMDTHIIDLTTGEQSQVTFAERAGMDGPQPIFDVTGSRAAFIRDGNVFVRDLRTDALTQLTKDPTQDRQIQFSSDAQTLYFLRGSQWHGVQIETGLTYPVSNIQFADDPDEPSDDYLTQMQQRLFTSLASDLAQEQARRAEQVRATQEDPTQAPAPWFVGDKMRPVVSSLSPDGRYLLQVVTPKSYARGQEGQMPHYVTLDGYIETESVRTRVGRNDPAPHFLWLMDLVSRSVTPLSLDALSTIQTDPLADLKQINGVDPWPEGKARDVSINGIQWHPTANIAAIQIRSRDNKDRWIATLDPAQGELFERHHLHDPAWINWRYNEMGWFGTHQSPKLWWLSEETGFSHLYAASAFGGEITAFSRGQFEVSSPELSTDETSIYVLANQVEPGHYDLYRIDVSTGDFLPVTSHGGIESFSLLPNNDKILVRFSSTYQPAQVGLVPATGGDITTLTDTRTDAFKAIQWQQPQFVRVPGHHGQSAVAAKFYPARTPRPDNGHPIVLFVHGAGYLQNVWARYPNYFREQMFHNFLTERGYHVLDMDFRASAGYGRDWRTAIYRQMGTPELEDLIDGVNWVVAEHGGDPDRVGLYGGSYGGFMAFMALFKAPDIFKAGAALRPVSDWAHYNHPYTSNILNTPEVDPEAYKRSSPIEFADGLQGHLLMTHGMLDDNVFYQDVVRLSQVLIDLEKDDWELASYPLERHGFQRPSSWRDQYRRIYHLFEDTIGYQNPID